LEVSVSDQNTTTPTWGYSKDGDEIFNLKAGEKLPDGFVSHPAMIKGSAAEKQMRADAKKEGLATHQFETDPKK
jgi:hypothetical protein